MYCRLALALVLACLALGLGAQVVSITPNPQTVEAQQNFTVTVHLDTATEVRGSTSWITYDPDKVTFVSAARGSLLDGFPMYWFIAAPETPDRVRISSQILQAGASVFGPGDLIYITFTAVEEGFTTLEFYDLQLYDLLGNVIPDVTTNSGDVIIGPSPAYLKAKCWLQGAYSNGSMHTLQNNVIPLTSPYAADPVTVDSIPEDVVDWCLLELRSTYNARPSVCKSVWLGSDGWLRLPDKPYLILMDSSAGPWYVVVRHRNHLAVMSSSAVYFGSSGSPPVLDLSDITSIYGGGGVKEVETGIVALAAGDANRDGVVAPVDRMSYWRPQSGLSGYYSADFDLDGFVAPRDLNSMWRLNTGLLSTVPASR